ncbi:MAG: WG repeat-containing protein [Oscillospiraceae bacterium]|nr:WG repeat-containing protein [Oscillospiraceae bacterium]
MRKLLSIIVIIAILLSLVACSQEKEEKKSDQPADLLARYEKALNNQDVHAFFDCVDPDAVEFLEGMLGIVGGIAGVKGDDLQKLFPMIMRIAIEIHEEGDDEPISVRFTEISTTRRGNGDNKAVILYEEVLIFADGTETSSEKTVSVIKINERWYLDALAEDVPVSDLKESEDEKPLFISGAVFENVNLVAAQDFETKKWGLADMSNNIVAQFDYDELGYAFDNGVIPARKGGYWGAINTNGDIIIDFMYDRLYSSYHRTNDTLDHSDKICFTNGYIFAELNKATGIINHKGETTLALAQNLGILDVNSVEPVYTGSDFYIVRVVTDVTLSTIVNVYGMSNELIKTFEDLEAYNNEYLYGYVSGDSGGRMATITDTKGNTIWSSQSLANPNAKFANISVEKNMFVVGNSVLDINGNGYELAYGGVEFYDDFFVARNVRVAEFHDYDLANPVSFFQVDGESSGFVEVFNNKYAVLEEGSDIVLYDIESKERHKFGSFRALTNNIAYVQDSNRVFYGVWVGDRLALECEYNKIERDGNFFILNKGAETLKAEIVDGEVRWIDEE